MFSTIKTTAFVFASLVLAGVTAQTSSVTLPAAATASAIASPVSLVTPVASPLPVSASAAPIGGPVALPPSEACTQARLDILVDLIVSQDATSKINSRNPATRRAVAMAQKGFAEIFTGIRTIAKEVLDAQPASATARDQVGNGGLVVQEALSGIKGHDATDPNVALALKTIALAAEAGNAVVTNCK
ncbi:hypothetical protein ONZ45_g16155 [Pleurotus djamor]|nr:hypothetical protein ONZ45_g16155 [Pleurotus djamor]